MSPVGGHEAGRVGSWTAAIVKCLKLKTAESGNLTRVASWSTSMRSSSSVHAALLFERAASA
jgi:hypothetical protein